MREKISVYVDELFSDAALTIRNAEVQQEILQHTLDRYDDLIAAGKSEQEAYDEAVGGIGDVSELYEHKPEAEAPKTRDFPAPPTPGVVFTAPQTPQSGKKKKLPGWAIALICVGAVVAILALNFAGREAFGVLRAGGRYIYDNANKYETLDRSGFGSKEQPAAASELLTDCLLYTSDAARYHRNRDPLADRRCVSGRIERGRRGFSGGLYRRQ